MRTADSLVSDLTAKSLQPLVSAIDLQGVYPGEFLRELGQAGHFRVSELSESERSRRNLNLIEEVSKTCNSTAFLVWCHVTGLSYVLNGESEYLRRHLLSKLESGEVLCGTGLSNPMKFYAGLEPLKLKARAVKDGYVCDGVLPFVSNLGPGHWFGVVAEVDQDHRVMLFVPCDLEGLTLQERQGFMGLNGTATYHCHFEGAKIPNEYVLSHDADRLVRLIRPDFVLSQTGMALGLSSAVHGTIHQLSRVSRSGHQYLRPTPAEIEYRLQDVRERAYSLAVGNSNAGVDFQRIARVRLESAYLALDTAQAGMLYCGGAGYVQSSAASRRLREAYFVALVTPTVKHLEKIVQDPASCRL